VAHHRYSFLDIHIQVWMALVAGTLLLWLVLVRNDAKRRLTLLA
jgi:hypothetical protein